MNLANLSTKRQWIAELARTKPGKVLFSLHHVIDLEWMRKAYWLTRKDGATGIDGVTAKEYEANLTANLLDLLDRIKSGRYQAPPVRRTYIPKADGSQRPLGIPIHLPIPEQHKRLSEKLRGHYAYYGITGNIRQLLKYAFQTERTWRKWLERRTRSAPLPWEQFRALLARHPLPRPRIVHRYVAVSQTLL